MSELVSRGIATVATRPAGFGGFARPIKPDKYH